MDAVREFLKQKGAAEHVVRDGLTGLVQSWERVVESVRSGYDFGLDDYLNDMDGRQLLDEALLVVASERQWLDRVRRADEAMKRLVRSTSRCLWGKKNASQHGWSPEKNWWYFSVPIASGLELTEDLKKKDL